MVRKSAPRTAKPMRNGISSKIQKVNSKSQTGRQFVLHKSGTLSTTGAGSIAGTLNVGDISTFSDFAGEFAALYDEYRVIGGRLKLYSTLGPGHTLGCSLMALAFDNDNATGSPASTDELIQYASSKVMNAGRDSKYFYTFERPASMNLWRDVASPSSDCGIKYYATTLTVSTLYFKYELEILVDFRGRR
jgi:hypothetical protein